MKGGGAKRLEESNNEKRVRVLVDEGKKYIEFCNEEQALIHLTKFYKEFGKENPLWSRSRTTIADDVKEAIRRLYN